MFFSLAHHRLRKIMGLWHSGSKDVIGRKASTKIYCNEKGAHSAPFVFSFASTQVSFLEFR